MYIQGETGSGRWEAEAAKREIERERTWRRTTSAFWLHHATELSMHDEATPAPRMGIRHYVEKGKGRGKERERESDWCERDFLIAEQRIKMNGRGDARYISVRTATIIIFPSLFLFLFLLFLFPLFSHSFTQCLPFGNILLHCNSEWNKRGKRNKRNMLESACWCVMYWLYRVYTVYS